MSNVRMAQKYTKKAVSTMDKLSHDEYKRIKHMPKLDLIAYLSRVWNDGYEAGRTAGIAEAKEAFNAATMEQIKAEEAPAAPKSEDVKPPKKRSTKKKVAPAEPAAAPDAADA